MPIGTPTSIGNSGAIGASANPISFTTTAAVPGTGALVLVFVSFYDAIDDASFSGGGLTWTNDATRQGTGDANYKVKLFSAQAPTGLASGTTLSCSFGGGKGNPMICGLYCEGLDTTAPFETSSGISTTGSNANYSCGSVTNVSANALIIGGCAIDGNRTCTPTSPATELSDFQNSNAATTFTDIYRVVSSVASYTLAGTLNSNLNIEKVGLVASYKAAAAAASSSIVVPKSRAYNGLRFRR